MPKVWVTIPLLSALCGAYNYYTVYQYQELLDLWNGAIYAEWFLGAVGVWNWLAVQIATDPIYTTYF